MVQGDGKELVSSNVRKYVAGATETVATVASGAWGFVTSSVKKIASVSESNSTTQGKAIDGATEAIKKSDDPDIQKAGLRIIENASKRGDTTSRITQCSIAGFVAIVMFVANRRRPNS